MLLVISVSVKVYDNFVLCLTLYTAEIEYYCYFGPREISNKHENSRELQNTLSLFFKLISNNYNTY
jgi:hypothetical protein